MGALYPELDIFPEMSKKNQGVLYSAKVYNRQYGNLLRTISIAR